MSIRGGALAVLRQRPFALLFVATSLSGLGTAVVPIALTFALLATGHSATGVGLVLMAETIPAVLLMLVGGVVGDCWPRRPVMVAADLLRCASQGLLASLLATGHLPLSLIMILSACVGTGNAFYGPAAEGLVPQAAGPDRIREANSLLRVRL